MPTTPGAGNLHSATHEIEDIKATVIRKAIVSHLDCPSAMKVVEKPQISHAVHFACHGISNSERPSDSHLILRKDDGTDLGTQDRLTVTDISKAKLQNAQIAYPSACSTAENSSIKLSDENIYIASGFQLAGFSHVLATQWESKDTACRQVARDFYRFLFSDQLGGSGGGESEDSHRKVSAALHSAVKKLRAQNLAQPLKWAPFIHTEA
ncbi:uncharacterized protein LAJ45_11465 [Morchella importuna]|uniref:uncharacterized protein n=1 Tax=Morchella importuna TaxID=1174673 RepID=UPI001E8D6286|nr:uncharacterized protein LAJ45_11465 [Morchella importuna]KAH8144525.1 hypothetical protein LAJ45_11465 [Morchella importuna]